MLPIAGACLMLYMTLAIHYLILRQKLDRQEAKLSVTKDWAIEAKARVEALEKHVTKQAQLLDLIVKTPSRRLAATIYRELVEVPADQFPVTTEQIVELSKKAAERSYDEFTGKIRNMIAELEPTDPMRKAAENILQEVTYLRDIHDSVTPDSSEEYKATVINELIGRIEGFMEGKG